LYQVCCLHKTFHVYCLYVTLSPCNLRASLCLFISSSSLFFLRHKCHLWGTTHGSVPILWSTQGIDVEFLCCQCIQFSIFFTLPIQLTTISFVSLQIQRTAEICQPQTFIYWPRNSSVRIGGGHYFWLEAI
jgi:hypothetical protein